MIGPWEFENKLREIAAIGDTEIAHGMADALLVVALEGLGYDCSAYKEMDKWFA